MPAVSVLLPVRNGSRWLAEAAASVQAQTLDDWELVIVDDHSSDAPATCLPDDPRIRLLPATGHGLVAALNQGLAACRAPLVARLDADDLMLPQRLALQQAAFAADPDLAVCATDVEAFPDDQFGAGLTEYLRWQHVCTDHAAICAHIFLESPVVHPSVMLRREVVDAIGGYRSGDFPEDYDLWLRLHAAGARFGRVPQVLTRWRQRPDSLSRTDPRCGREAFDQLRAEYLSAWLREHVDPERPLVYAGAGPRTRRRARVLQRMGHAPALYLDIDPHKVGRVYEGARCVHLEDLPLAPLPFVLIYVASHHARRTIPLELRARGLALGADWLQVG